VRAGTDPYPTSSLSDSGQTATYILLLASADSAVKQQAYSGT